MVGEENQVMARGGKLFRPISAERRQRAPNDDRGDVHLLRERRADALSAENSTRIPVTSASLVDQDLFHATSVNSISSEFFVAEKRTVVILGDSEAIQR
jgi:hypothetical protein